MDHGGDTDDARFLDEVRVLLPDRLGPLGHGARLVGLRVVGGRPWERIELQIERDDGSTAVVHEVWDASWRWDAGYEEPDLYAARLEHGAWRVVHGWNEPDPSMSDPSPAEVVERWQWLIDRLSYDGAVVTTLGPGRLRVSERVPHWSPYDVLVTPEQWAPVAAPVDTHPDDPQDWNRQQEEDRFLVFHEGALCWSVREELPPVRWGAAQVRDARRARTRGEDRGWFAYAPLDAPSTSEP